MSIALKTQRSPRAAPVSYRIVRSTARSPIQLDSARGKMFGCCPRHHVRTLVPERGDPTTKTGLAVWSCMSVAHPSRHQVEECELHLISGNFHPTHDRSSAHRNRDISLDAREQHELN